MNIKNIKNYEGKWDMLWFVLFPILNINYIITGNIYSSGNQLFLPYEKTIPLIPIFILPYIYWYFYMVIGYFVLSIKDRKKYMKGMYSLFIGMCVCYTIYYLFPTEFVRVSVENNNILNKLINLIYGADKPFNCFPSLHVLGTYFVMRLTLKDNKFYWLYTQIVGTMIILSTVFIKQHFIVDIIASVIIVELIIYNQKYFPDSFIEKSLTLPSKLLKAIDIRRYIIKARK